MFSEPIEMWDAVIPTIHHKNQDGKVQTRIMVTATLSQEMAEDLGCKSLVFAENGTPKEGFSKMELDTGCAAFRAVFEADPALKQSFELLSGDSTDCYLVTRMAEGTLQLKLRLNYHGDPHQALAYVMSVGSAESVLKIIPLQRELDAEEKPAMPAAERNREAITSIDKATTPVVSKEAVRQRLTTHRSKKPTTAEAVN